MPVQSIAMLASPLRPLLLGLLLTAAAVFWAAPTRAAGVLAGTEIANTAQLSYTIGASSVTEPSNTVRLTVAEILDVVVTLQSANVTVSPGATGQVLVYRVTNTGNGVEPFLLQLTTALGGDDFDPTPATPSIFVDTDASGTLTPADTPYVPGGNDPSLSADAFVTILVVSDIPGALANGARGFAQLSADARTGTGVPGTAFAAQGTGGTDAVVGATGAAANATGTYLVADVLAAAVKSATVTDQFGGARPVPGATIRYQIVVSATGTGTATAAQFNDAIPANTTYVPASLRLNGAALTDAADADAGSFVTTPASGVRVALGDLSQASGPQTIVFDVTIN